MRPLGYLYKQIVTRPDWLNANQVVDIYSLSGCVSKDFADYVNFWKHNGYWLFNSPSTIESLAAEHSISLEGMKLFYYEAYEQEYDDDNHIWLSYEPEVSFDTSVLELSGKIFEGFDVVCFFCRTTPECSPLSCNRFAEKLGTNSHCLFNTFEEAVYALESGLFANLCSGPYRVIAVYSIDAV